jgi:hypothetical protein
VPKTGIQYVTKGEKLRTEGFSLASRRKGSRSLPQNSMKLHLLFCAALVAGMQAQAATTNTFPTTGNAGIGTTAPTQLLQIVATGTGNAEEILQRPTTSQLSLLQFTTATTTDWGLGTWNNATSDFNIYNYGEGLRGQRRLKGSCLDS